MPPDHLQRFITEHPLLFWAVIFPAYFISLWLLVSTVISLIGGWFSLSKIYRARGQFLGTQLRRQSGQMRWLAKYGGVLTLGTNQEGLYLANMFLFRFMHPPLLIPWEQVRIRRGKFWFFEYVTFILGRELAIPLQLRSKLADQLRSMAGDRWPTEDT